MLPYAFHHTSPDYMDYYSRYKHPFTSIELSMLTLCAEIWKEMIKNVKDTMKTIQNFENKNIRLKMEEYYKVVRNKVRYHKLIIYFCNSRLYF